MVISTRANLIPYDRGYYRMLPQRPHDALVVSEDTVEHRCRFQQAPEARVTFADSENIYGNRYNSHRRWQYADDYQVGGSIDIYA